MKWRSWLESVRVRAWEHVEPVARWLWAHLGPLGQFLLHGPRHRFDEPPGLSETLFPWPVRLALVVGSWLLTRLWVHTSTAGQIGWTLEYAGVVAISLVASFWFYIFIVDLVFSLLWLGLTHVQPPDPEKDPYLYWISHGVELVNRQLTHIEGFMIWMGVILPFTPRIDFQIPALLGLALIGPPLIDWITERRHPEVTRGSGELQSARRPLIYFCMILGLLILVWRSTDQRFNLLRLVVALLLVMGIRIRRHVVRKRHVDDHGEHVAAFRRHQRQLTRGIDVMLGPVLMLVSVVGVLVLSLWVRQSHDQLAREKLDGPPPDPRVCVAEPGGPVRDDKHPLHSMFIVADSQVHELGGERFPGQTELADLLVPSAVRPVELDMLGGASVAELQHAFEEVVRDAQHKPVYWAHLGDFADLSCTGELRRAVEMFAAFARPGQGGQEGPKLAGIAPGNHDMSFTGNFFWSPYWTGACKSTRADKVASNEMIGRLLDPKFGVISKDARVSRPDRSPVVRWLAGTGGLVTVSRLGTILHHGKSRDVVAIFVDTGDDATLDWGIAGLFGTYSGNQDDRLRALVGELKVAEPKVDPVWLVFAHHPLGELTGPSRDRLESTLAWLDDDPLDQKPAGAPELEPEPRLLGIIAAHTHRAETHRLCVARRVVREIVVGSTIDSAQQGALLEIGSDPKEQASIRLKTVQTVARPGFTCGPRPAVISADECQRIVARLKCNTACEPLFDEGLKAARDCSELEQPTGFGDAVRDLIGSTSPVEPDAIKQAQRMRARRLLSCVCRTTTDTCAGPGLEAPPAEVAGQCDPLGKQDDPLDDDVFARRIGQRLASGGDEARKELACLSWAASAQQQHKARGMTFASALRCAFDDETIPAEQETVATLDVQPCQ